MLSLKETVRMSVTVLNVKKQQQDVLRSLVTTTLS